MLVYILQELKEAKRLQNSNQSFAPIHYNSTIKSFIDGKDYFESLYDDLSKAENEVYITGWRISPLFCLDRSKRTLS